MDIQQVHVKPEDRYESHIDRSGGPAVCHPWTGCVGRNGYGRFSIGKKYIGASRYGYELHVGPIPDGHGVLHHCDFPPCQNPTHWFTGTGADNTADMLAKGRARGAPAGDANWAHRNREKWRGEGNPAAIVTAEDVSVIRQRYAAGGISQRALAREYGISRPGLADIVCRRNWKHIP